MQATGSIALCMSGIGTNFWSMLLSGSLPAISKSMESLALLALLFQIGGYPPQRGEFYPLHVFLLIPRFLIYLNKAAFYYLASSLVITIIQRGLL